MKYIRTETNIFEVIGENEKVYIVIGVSRDRKNAYSKSKCQTTVFNQADSIEELCDEFVGIRPNKVYAISNDFYQIKHIANNEYLDVYGAIWTSKGLIYVAKMNKKGELELI